MLPPRGALRSAFGWLSVQVKAHKLTDATIGYVRPPPRKTDRRLRSHDVFFEVVKYVEVNQSSGFCADSAVSKPSNIGIYYEVFE